MLIGSMETEIELKYLVDANNVEDEVSKLLDRQNIKYEKKSKSLINSYFDTTDLTLRKLDMGLRVRTYPERCEQTIKTAGIVVGGLHQRPEYNINIDASQPDLSLFPPTIWPENYDITFLQGSIVPIFSTDFERITWQVSHELGVVELAYDKGVIESNNQSEVISEIELELLSGEVNALFEVAKTLFSALIIRPGLKSKAARGYALWQSNDEAQVAELSSKAIDDIQIMLVPLRLGLTQCDAFYIGLKYGLEQIQHNISLYLEHRKFRYLAIIRKTMDLLSYGLANFDGFIDNDRALALKKQIISLNMSLAWVDKAQHVKDITRKSGKYRKKLEYSAQLIDLLRLKRDSFPTEEAVVNQLQSADFNILQLDLLALFIARKEPAEQEELNQFSYDALEQGLESLIAETPNSESMSAEQYLALKPYLNKSLLAGIWFGSLYDEELRADYRSPWLDILQGIDELAIFSLLQNQLQQLEEQPEKLIGWLNRKIEHLVDALDHSRKVALSVEPYWHNT